MKQQKQKDLTRNIMRCGRGLVGLAVVLHKETSLMLIRITVRRMNGNYHRNWGILWYGISFRVQLCSVHDDEPLGILMENLESFMGTFFLGEYLFLDLVVIKRLVSENFVEEDFLKHVSRVVYGPDRTRILWKQRLNFIQ